MWEQLFVIYIRRGSLPLGSTITPCGHHLGAFDVCCSFHAEMTTPTRVRRCDGIQQHGLDAA
jgi:hypothetical protein